MILTSTETIPGKAITQSLGLVSGSTIRAKHAGKDMMAGIKNLFGGELKAYSELLNESRKEAMGRLIEQAKSVQADAVVNIRFSTSSITQGAAEIYIYGTAVKIQ